MNIFLLIGTCLFFLLLGFVLGICLKYSVKTKLEIKDTDKDEYFIGAIDLEDEKNKDVKEHIENLIKEIKEDE